MQEPKEPQPQTLLCSVCGKTKDVDQFYPRSDNPGKYRQPCKKCYIKKQIEYNETDIGGINRLKISADISQEDAEKWYPILKHDDTHCAICHVPRRILKKMYTFKVGDRKRNRRLSLDHIQPGISNGNYRALCLSCNVIRKDEHFTDAEVLHIMQNWYLFLFTPHRLWWMNTHYNPKTGLCEGGRKERSPRMEQKIADLLEGDDEGI